MNQRAEIQPRQAEAPIEINENELLAMPKPIDHRPTESDSIDASDMLKHARESKERRREDARKLLEIELDFQPLSQLLPEYAEEVKVLEARVSNLAEANTQIEQELELAKEKLNLAQELFAQQTEEKSEEAIEIIPEYPDVEESTPEPIEIKPKKPKLEEIRPTINTEKFLQRFNRWLRGSGITEQTSLSETRFDRDRMPEARAAREQARRELMENIAVNALAGHQRALEQDQIALREAQTKARNASFLTRWIHQGRVQELEESIRGRETAIRIGEERSKKQQQSRKAA